MNLSLRLTSHVDAMTAKYLPTMKDERRLIRSAPPHEAGERESVKALQADRDDRIIILPIDQSVKPIPSARYADESVRKQLP